MYSVMVGLGTGTLREEIVEENVNAKINQTVWEIKLKLMCCFKIVSALVPTIRGFWDSNWAYTVPKQVTRKDAANSISTHKTHLKYDYSRQSQFSWADTVCVYKLNGAHGISRIPEAELSYALQMVKYSQLIWLFAGRWEALVLIENKY